MLRHDLFVVPLEQGKDLAAGTVLDQAYNVLDPEEIPEGEGHRDKAPLVVGPAGADLFGAGAQGSDRNLNPHEEFFL